MKGEVIECFSKNIYFFIGDIEIWVSEFMILNVVKILFFMIEDDMDGGEELWV